MGPSLPESSSDLQKRHPKRPCAATCQDCAPPLQPRGSSTGLKGNWSCSGFRFGQLAQENLSFLGPTPSNFSRQHHQSSPLTLRGPILRGPILRGPTRDPPFGAPPFGAPPFGAPPFGAPPFGAPPLRGPIFLGLGPTLWAMTHNWPKLVWPKNGLAKNGLAKKWSNKDGQKRIGQKWIGPNWSNQDGQNGIGQSRSLPYSLAVLLSLLSNCLTVLLSH